MIEPLPGNVIVRNLKHGERKVGSFVIANDDGKTHGARPRWAEVYAVGPDIETLVPGNWVLVQHGRWTRELKLDNDHEYRKIEYPEGALMVSDTEPPDDIILDSMEYGELKR